MSSEPTGRRWPAWLTGPVLSLALVLAVLAPLIFHVRGAEASARLVAQREATLGERWSVYVEEGLDTLRRWASLRTLQVIANDVTIVGIVALGALLIILTGGIDLSVGSVAALTTVTSMLAYRAVYPSDPGGVLPALAAVGVGLLTGTLAGLMNGLVVTRIRVTPFIATLGLMGIARGLAYYLSEKRGLGFPGGKPAWMQALTAPDSPVLFPPLFWSFLVLAGLVALLLRYHILGRWCYAIGSSEATARACGVPVEQARILLYALAGLLTGWAGLVSFVEVSGSPTSSQDLALDVIAAVVIGGASLSGGRGTVAGTLLGVLIVGVLNNGVGFLGVSVEVRFLLVGLVIIGSTALGRIQGRRSAEGS